MFKLLGDLIHQHPFWLELICGTYLISSVRQTNVYSYCIGQTLLTLLQWYVRTPLEFAKPVWHPRPDWTVNSSTNRWTKYRRDAFMLFWDPGIPPTEKPTLNSVNLYSLTPSADIIWPGRSMLRSRRHGGLCPLTELWVHCCNRRHGDKLRPPTQRSSRYAKTFVPYVVALLNQSLNNNTLYVSKIELVKFLLLYCSFLGN